MEAERVGLSPPFDVRGGRQTDFAFATVTGTLKGYDQLMNLVLDNVKEITRGAWRNPFPAPIPV